MAHLRPAISSQPRASIYAPGTARSMTARFEDLESEHKTKLAKLSSSNQKLPKPKPRIGSIALYNNPALWSNELEEELSKEEQKLQQFLSPTASLKRPPAKVPVGNRPGSAGLKQPSPKPAKAPQPKQATPAPKPAPVAVSKQMKASPGLNPAALSKVSPKLTSSAPSLRAELPKPPVQQPTPQPVVQTALQPVVQPAPQPTPQPTPQPAPQPVVQPAPGSPAIGQKHAHKTSEPVEDEEKWHIKFEDLEIEEMISSGEAGQVFLGYFFGTPVAIKKLFLDPSQRHLMESEYRMLKELHHPNIVQFLGLCIDESGIYLVTEYVDHGDLFDLLVFGDADISWRDRVRIAVQIAQACLYLHNKNIIHRDLKGLNVLLGDNYRVKLCDLGLATVMENNAWRNTVCGTDQWMAPEIVMGEPYDFAVDVFSFGLVLTELISKRPPVARSIKNCFAFDWEGFSASCPPDCPEDFKLLVRDCTMFKPSDRPTFKEILPRLRAIASTL